MAFALRVGFEPGRPRRIKAVAPPVRLVGRIAPGALCRAFDVRVFAPGARLTLREPADVRVPASGFEMPPPQRSPVTPRPEHLPTGHTRHVAFVVVQYGP